MSSYVQISGDPTRWWFDQPIDSSSLTDQPVSIELTAPLLGALIVSPRSAASVAIVHPGAEGAIPSDLDILAPTIYLPTATGPSAGSVIGYQLPVSADLTALAAQITAAMRAGTRQAIALGGASMGGALVLNGATLAFAVVCKVNAPAGLSNPSGGGAIPSD